MKRLICCLLLFAFLLIACTSQELSDAFDQETLEDTAGKTVELLNDRNFEDVTALVREDLQELLSAQQLETALEPVLDDYGTFEEIKSITMVGSNDAETQEEFAVCVLICNYENGKATYTLTFDTEYQLVGLYLK